MRTFRIHFVFGAAVVLVFACLDWLLMWESSPLQHYFLFHVELPNLWRKLHTIPYIAGMVASGNVHQASAVGYYAVAAIQWNTLGLILAVLFTKFRARSHDTAA